MSMNRGGKLCGSGKTAQIKLNDKTNWMNGIKSDTIKLKSYYEQKPQKNVWKLLGEHLDTIYLKNWEFAKCNMSSCYFYDSRNIWYSYC